MPLTFPASPTQGDLYTSENGVEYVYDNGSWTVSYSTPDLISQADLSASMDANTSNNINESDLASNTANGIVILASKSQWLSGDPGRVLEGDQVWESGKEVGLTDAATISVDLNTGANFNVTLGASRTLGNPTNAKPGQSGYIAIYSGGAYTLSYGINWKFEDDTAPTNSANTSAKDLLCYTVMNDSNVYAVLATNVPD